MKTLLVFVFLVASAAAQHYDTATLLKFRAEREVGLKADNGWLTVAGLHFLNQGENRVGSDASSDIVLDFPTVPAHAAVITLRGTAVTIQAPKGQTLTINGKAVTESELHGPFDGRPQDTVSFGPVTFFVHYSGPRLALRVRDAQNRMRTNFTGLRWYEPNPSFRVVGTFTPYPAVKTVEVLNILGDLEPFRAVGTVNVKIAGTEHTLEAWRSRERLWFVFRDQTSGKETYPAARFVYADAPTGGTVVLDFNFAVNPPCAYNPYTTCPLPPAQNRLPIPIAAGEKKYLRES